MSLTLNSQESLGFVAPVEGDGKIMRSQPLIPNRGNIPSSKASTIRIAETFTSLQGEGQLTGTRSFFIRTSGCNLRCWFCDTPYASWQPEGGAVDIRQLVDDAVASGCDHVVLTGGEPLLPIQCVDFVNLLREVGLHVTIETAGTVFRPLTADLISISPKLASSGPRAGNDKWASRHEMMRWQPEVIRRLVTASIDYQIKFVVDNEADFKQTVLAVDELAIPADHVWIMPQGIEAKSLDQQARWLRPMVAAEGFRYCDRMHVRWYGNKRGT